MTTTGVRYASASGTSIGTLKLSGSIEVAKILGISTPAEAPRLVTTIRELEPTTTIAELGLPISVKTAGPAIVTMCRKIHGRAGLSGESEVSVGLLTAIVTPEPETAAGVLGGLKTSGIPGPPN